MYKQSILENVLIGLIFVCLTAGAALAQSTAFTFQGRLNDGSTAAVGNVQLEIKLYDSLTGGTQISSTLNIPTVPLINGVFSTELDFGGTAFDGSPRFLEIGVRPAGSTNPFTILSPRQHLSSVPYATQSKNAAQLGGIDANQYVTTATVGSTFIRNGTTAQTGNFNIDGNGVIGGNVGIGTATPTSKLQVVQSNGYGITQTDGTITVGSFINSRGGWFGTKSNHSLNFFTNDSQPQMTLSTAGNLGIGVTPAPGFGRLQVRGTTGSNDPILFAENTTSGINNIGVSGWSTNGIGVFGKTSNPTNGFGVYSDGFLGIRTGFLGSAGNISLCLNGMTEQVATCSSSLRYKKDFQPFGEGLSFINQLRPIAYKWKADNLPDIGFGAEDVAKINPLFVTYNAKGEVEGVKYDRLGVVFVNAFKEQQVQIEQLRVQIESLKRLVCVKQPNAVICHGK